MFWCLKWPLSTEQNFCYKPSVQVLHRSLTKGFIPLTHPPPPTPIPAKIKEHLGSTISLLRQLIPRFNIEQNFVKLHLSENAHFSHLEIYKGSNSVLKIMSKAANCPPWNIIIFAVSVLYKTFTVPFGITHQKKIEKVEND